MLLRQSWVECNLSSHWQKMTPSRAKKKVFLILALSLEAFLPSKSGLDTVWMYVAVTHNPSPTWSLPLVAFIEICSRPVAVSCAFQAHGVSANAEY